MRTKRLFLRESVGQNNQKDFLKRKAALNAGLVGALWGHARKRNA